MRYAVANTSYKICDRTENIRTAIKNQTFPNLTPNTKPVDAFLLADSNNSSSFVTDTTVDPSSVPIDIFFEENTFDVSTNKTSVSQIAFNKIGSQQTSTIQNSTRQISLYQGSTTKSSISQISTSEVGAIQTSGVKESSTEIGITQINTFDVGFGQIQPTEVDSTQIITNWIAEIQPITSEISDSSSVEPENLFVLQQWFVNHTFSPKSPTKLSNTLNSLWNDNLSTPFDLNVEILDLPKGQLAEATIAGFDSSGKPNSGTIFIDYDANGVGWFIDETSLDNSEFTNQNSASYFLADLESAANGKYDLLTTVLHELAHLYGFIDGYAGFE